MKKFYYLLSALLLIGSYANAQVFSSNFDNWTAGIPDGWDGPHSSLEGDSIIQVSTGSIYGSNSCQLVNAQSSHKRFNTDSVLSVVKNVSYEVKFWVKGQGDIRTNIYSGGYGSYNNYIAVNTSSWTMYTQTVTADSTVSNAEIIFSVRNTIASSNHLQLDSVVISTTTVPSVSIYDLQYTTAPGGDSPYNGQSVLTGGIVSAVKTADTTGYFIQNGVGPWQGIYVYDTGNIPAIGDSITLSANVTEYFNMTELTNVNNYTVVSSGNTPYAAQGVTTMGVNDEQYEGVLVQVTNANCTNPSAGFGMFEVNDGSGVVLVDDQIYQYTATLNTAYNVTGVVDYSFSEYKILPRFLSDISIFSGIEEQQTFDANLYPVPARDNITIQVNESVNYRVIDSKGSIVLHGSISKPTNLDVSGLSNGIYSVVLTNGTHSNVNQISIIH